MRDPDRRLGGFPEHNTSLEGAFDELPPRRWTRGRSRDDPTRI